MSKLPSTFLTHLFRSTFTTRQTIHKFPQCAAILTSIIKHPTATLIRKLNVVVNVSFLHIVSPTSNKVASRSRLSQTPSNKNPTFAAWKMKYCAAKTTNVCTIQKSLSYEKCSTISKTKETLIQKRNRIWHIIIE